MPPGKTTRPCVYVMRDIHGVVIYVGRSVDVLTRIETHRRERDWFADVETIEVRHVATQDDAVTLELNLIHEHQPPHNVNGIPGRMWPRGGAGGRGRDLIDAGGF